MSMQIFKNVFLKMIKLLKKKLFKRKDGGLHCKKKKELGASKT
jgi:hypothetical protein